MQAASCREERADGPRACCRAQVILEDPDRPIRLEKDNDESRWQCDERGDIYTCRLKILGADRRKCLLDLFLIML